MKLSELNTNLKIINNDVDFESLGLALEHYNDKPFLSFLYNEYFMKKILSNDAITAVVTTEQVAELLLKEKPSLGILISNDPKNDFYHIHNTLYESGFYKQNTIKSHISPTAILHPSVNLMGENITIGENTIIEPNVVIHDNVSIGNNCTIKSGAVIGGSSCITYVNEDNRNAIVKSLGCVVIKNNVYINSNSVIDKGRFNTTLIESHVIIDSLVYIAHDVIIKENTILLGGTVVSGYTVIEQDSYTGPNSTISDALLIQKNAKISLGAVVINNVKSNQTMSGNFAMDHTTCLKIQHYTKKKISKL